MKYININVNLADYWHRLSDEEKDWLKKFESEYGGRTSAKGKRLHTEEQIKEAWRCRNRKRRDVYYRGQNLRWTNWQSHNANWQFSDKAEVQDQAYNGFTTVDIIEDT
jgi:hypothetical protein